MQTSTHRTWTLRATTVFLPLAVVALLAVLFTGRDGKSQDGAVPSNFRYTLRYGRGVVFDAEIGSRMSLQLTYFREVGQGVPTR